MEAIVPLRVVAKLARFAGIKSLTLRPPVRFHFRDPPGFNEGDH